MDNNEEKRTLKGGIKNLWRNHKGKILIAAGVVASIGIGILLKNKPEEVVEESVEPEKVNESSYTLHWFQGTDPDSSWTLDLPVDNNSTVEIELQKAKDELNNGRYSEVEL
jgi:hypothetical protein